MTGVRHRQLGLDRQQTDSIVLDHQGRLLRGDDHEGAERSAHHDPGHHPDGPLAARSTFGSNVRFAGSDVRWKFLGLSGTRRYRHWFARDDLYAVCVHVLPRGL